MTQTLSNFAAVFINVKEENPEGPQFSCACETKFQNLFELVLHGSQMHFIEFSKIAAKLKTLIDDFIEQDEKCEQKVIKNEEYFEPSSLIECLNDDSLNQVKDVENTEETIILLLEESGEAKIEDDVPPKSKSKVKSSKKTETVSSLKKVEQQAPVRAIKHGRRPSNSYKCPNCPMIFEKKSLMKQHRRATHKFMCDDCGQSYVMKLNLKMHIVRDHQGKKTYCAECAIQTTNLEEHAKKHVKDPQTLFMCDICGKEIIGKQRMNNHMNRSHKRKVARFHCKDCNAGFYFLTDLKQHAIKHDPDRQEHKCSVCDKTYKRRAELREHIKAHTGQKWICEECGKEYAFKRGLKLHQKTNCTAKRKLE